VADVTQPDPTVETSGGTLRGTREEGLCVFRGVPFAGPPTGERRFQPPTPAPSWQGVRDAARIGPAPPQIQDPLSQRIGLDLPGPMLEDCLQLNVWTPGVDDSRRPVMVWLHGGAFATGSGTARLYAGHRIAARADVVVVTLNYRVGALGFLHLASVVPGAGGPNLGLLDQIAALRFVKQEIAGFGGDPTQITVFGESAGAGSLVALLAMPKARRLFERAIIQSPAPDGMLSEEEGSTRARIFLDELGLQSPRLEELHALSVDRLLEAQQACIAAGPHRTGMFFAPVIDGASLPERPLDAIDRGVAREVELIIGTTEEEMQLYSTIPGLGDFPDEILVQVIASRLSGDEATRQALARKALAVYRADLAAPDPSQQELFFALETDLSLRVPSTQLAAAHASFQSRTYMYLFQWRSPMPDGHGGTLGACHALDLPFTFGSLEAGASLAFAAGDDPALQRQARTLSDGMIDAWTAFARTGDPSHTGIGVWPSYDRKRRTTMLLGPECRACEKPLETRRAVWQEESAG
jgi:para-nitrobenzyl esterase